jgi:hypothetical protein
MQGGQPIRNEGQIRLRSACLSGRRAQETIGAAVTLRVRPIEDFVPAGKPVGVGQTLGALVLDEVQGLHPELREAIERALR